MGNAQKKSAGPSSGVASPARSGAREGNPGSGERKNTALANGAHTAEGERRGDEEETGSTGAHGGENLDAPAGDLPPALARLKNEGNMLFKRGQFGLALHNYSRVIEGLSGAGIDSPEDLCILYSNRAACYLKDGNCTDCIQDCTSALELRPFSLKPLLRRAMAYEALERYRKAYVDYKTVLQIDSSVQAAHDSVHRITKQLIEQDGPDWREKLPEIPNVPISAQQHRREEPSAEVLQARAERAEQEKARRAEARFTLLKQEGNDLVKRGEFENAVEKYSECVALKPAECTVYTNRALCFLKLERFAEARQDCDSALKLEPDNKKAFYRRALAHKGLKDFLSSSSDLQEVLRLDPNVHEAEQELQEVTVLLRESLLESHTQG
ncbi:sperm-associated antigen 1A [Neoarius graeffei]|uniref:sperm-associated antigen 1A n=1 Tax=Neoarius graeffei TaxID=443677 RepID=UPI00298D5BEF|nr:sperm-associated antigen 1A [Neoarius graeffei]